MAGRIEGSAGSQGAGGQERGARFPLFMSWWTICSAIFYLYLGPMLATTFGSINAIIGIMLTVLTYSVIASIFAGRAISTGWSVRDYSEKIFGRAGSAFSALILGLTALYYAIFEGSVLALAVAKAFGSIDYASACLLVIAFTIPFVLSERILVYFERANFVLLPVYLLWLAALVLLAGSRYGWDGDWLALGPADAPPFGWWDCYVAYMGVWVLIVITKDFARLGRPEDKAFHARITFGLPFYIMTFLVNGLVGIFLVGQVEVAEISEAAIVDASLVLLGGGVGLAFIAATQLRINLANFYVSSFNTCSMIDALTGWRPPYWAVVLATCGLAVLLMISQGAFDYMLVSLQYMGIFLCSWVGIALIAGKDLPLIADHPAETGGKAMAAWIGATLVAVVISFVPGIVGSFAPAASFLLAILAYQFLVVRNPEV